TAEAIAARQLELAGWVANQIDPTMARFEANLQTLRDLLPAPLLGVVPHLPDKDSRQASAALTQPSLFNAHNRR
ncbi:MAG: dethiobiotin synthase, partial [Azonexus sp.]|nr:dethiobiotin synthase [Azonexus sp.]